MTPVHLETTALGAPPGAAALTERAADELAAPQAEVVQAEVPAPAAVAAPGAARSPRAPARRPRWAEARPRGARLRASLGALLGHGLLVLLLAGAAVPGLRRAIGGGGPAALSVAWSPRAGLAERAARPAPALSMPAEAQAPPPPLELGAPPPPADLAPLPEVRSLVGLAQTPRELARHVEASAARAEPPRAASPAAPAASTLPPPASAALSGAASAPAAESGGAAGAAPRPRRTGPVELTPPRVVERPRVVWPSRCRRRGHQGSARMLLVVTTTGEVARVEVVQSAGCERLDEAAREAAADYRFAPGTRDGRRSEWTVFVEIQFGDPAG